jgi:pyruvate/2-oxoglutarate dehydrogenase complex dihydrolipoamide acyltransferase (E2) component/uncharacterized OsmC-like protein
MSTHRLVMPKLGQAMEFGAVAEWLIADGTVVRAGQPVVSVESDKATYEIEATVDGVLHHVAAVGQEVPVGEPLAEIGDGDVRQPQGAYALPRESAAGAGAAPAAATARAAQPTLDLGGRVLASPKAKALARRLGVDLAGVAAHRGDGLIVAGDVEAAASAGRPMASPKAKALAQRLDVDIRAVVAHRQDGLIVASDVEAAAAARRAEPAPAAGAPRAGGTAIPLTRLRRVGADRLARSWRQAPHIVQMIEVDATQLVKAQAALRRSRPPGTLNDILIKAAAECLAKHPHLNVRFDEDKLIPLDGVDIGLAVATDEGLTVPVVRGADALPLAEVSTATRELIAAARAGRLTGRQVGGASLTISNLGAYGISFGTPVLNLDEPVLIFVGAVEERPVAENGQLAVRAMTTLSLAYDHRVVDGLQAALFSRALKQRLENLEGLLPEAGAGEPAPDLAERQLQARSAEGGLAVQLRSARHAWTVDEPADIGGADAGPDPVTYVLGGLLSCMIVALKLAARRRKVEIGEVRGAVTATPKGKVKTIGLRLEVWSAAARAEVEALLPSAKASCYVHDMLKPDLPVEIELVAHPAA